MFRGKGGLNIVLKQVSRASGNKFAVVYSNAAIRSVSYSGRLNAASTGTEQHNSHSMPLESLGQSGATNSMGTPSTSTQHILDAINQCHAVGNVKDAVLLVGKAQEGKKTTAAMYRQLLKTLLNAPFDIDAGAIVASWFYSPDSKLPVNVKNDLLVWRQVLKLGLCFGGTYRKEDLRVLADSFCGTFDVSTLKDQQCLELLIRAYGILGKKDQITSLFTQLSAGYTWLDEASLEEHCALAYASTGANQQVEKMVAALQSSGKINEKFLLKLIRTYGFNGDMARTQRYIDLCQQLYPDVSDHFTMQLMVHKVTLAHQHHLLVRSRGKQGLSLKPQASPELDRLHASWERLLSQKKNNIVEVTHCNIILEYLAMANRIDPAKYPISKAQQLVDEHMPAHNIRPNEMTWKTLLKAYATTREFGGEKRRNVRLDKALDVLSRMDEDGYSADQFCFHALFKACLPYLPGRGFVFDDFFLASEMTSALHFRPNLDPRIFELEKIMISSKIPHDRTTLKLMLTTLGATGHYQAMWNRWALLKMSAVERDMGLYQHVFSLASMDPVQSRHALFVIRNELGRQVSHNRIPWNTYVAMLDCAITAQMPDEATMIIREMRHGHMSPRTIDKNVKPVDMYVPILRAYTGLPALAPEVPKLLQEMKTKGISYNTSIWQSVMSHHLLHDDSGAAMQNVQQTFNSFTMQRFEKEGKIPIPVRESSPIVPFPSAPYTINDMAMINMYIAALVDAQDISLVFDVLRTLEKETRDIGLSRETILGAIKLAKQEKSASDLSWLVHQVLPRVSSQNSRFRKWSEGLQKTVSKLE